MGLKMYSGLNYFCVKPLGDLEGIFYLMCWDIMSSRVDSLVIAFCSM